MKDKIKLRKQIRHVIAETSDSELAANSEQICQHLARNANLLDRMKTIAVYAAHKNEVSLSKLHQLLPQHQLLYPLCHDAGRLSYHHIINPNTLIPGMMGILEPHQDNHPEFAVNSIDLFLCPGLAFTLGGHRLGQGGGYYDRILSQKNAASRVIGVCTQQQVLDEIPYELHDIKMGYLLTERGLQKAI